MKLSERKASEVIKHEDALDMFRVPQKKVWFKNGNIITMAVDTFNKIMSNN